MATTLHASWVAWDGSTTEEFTLRWDNGGWVAEGIVSGSDVQYVLRLGPDFRTRQFLLFRDLDEPDLWLVADGQGRWAEMNGAERHDLTGCFDLDLTCSPSTSTIPITALGLEIGESATVEMAVIDVATLAVDVATRTYTRLDDEQWRIDDVEVFVDGNGFVVDHPERFRRVLRG